MIFTRTSAAGSETDCNGQTPRSGRPTLAYSKSPVIEGIVPGNNREVGVELVVRLGKQAAVRVRELRPALKAAGITVKVGWHTFRHSYATILKSHGEDVKTVQELLRRAKSSITLNLYAQAVTDTKRTAQSKIARLVFDSGKPSNS